MLILRETDSRNFFLIFNFHYPTFLTNWNANPASPQAHLVLDSHTKQPKGLAYVTFAKPEEALAAYEALDKTSFQGRLLHLLPAVDRRSKVEDGEGDGKKRSLKQDREAKRKATAGKEFNWAMLYMNVRTVVANISSFPPLSRLA